mgnify:CR=1 FL=1
MGSAGVVSSLRAVVPRPLPLPSGHLCCLEKLGDVERKRSGTAIESYEINLAEGAIGDPLARAMPPELMR